MQHSDDTLLDTAYTLVLLLAAVVLSMFLASLAACDDGEPLYWQPDLTPHECSKTLRTCDPETELCFEGTCTPTCWDHDECPDGYFCAGVSESMETRKICWREP